MTARDLVRVVSRGVSLYFFAWTLDNVTYLPGIFLLLSHHLGSALSTDNYWHSSDVLRLLFTLLRIALLFAVGKWLYTCGPGVEAFFLRDSEREP